MYYKLKEEELKIIKKIEKITLTDYEIKENLIPIDSLMAIIYDLKYELGLAEEKYNDLERDLEDNYRPISKAEQYE